MSFLAGFSNAAPLSNLAILSSNFAFFNASFPVFGGGALAAFWWGVGSSLGLVVEAWARA